MVCSSYHCNSKITQMAHLVFFCHKNGIDVAVTQAEQAPLNYSNWTFIVYSKRTTCVNTKQWWWHIYMASTLIHCLTIKLGIIPEAGELGFLHYQSSFGPFEIFWFAPASWKQTCTHSETHLVAIASATITTHYVAPSYLSAHEFSTMVDTVC